MFFTSAVAPLPSTRDCTRHRRFAVSSPHSSQHESGKLRQMRIFSYLKLSCRNQSSKLRRRYRFTEQYPVRVCGNKVVNLRNERRLMQAMHICTQPAPASRKIRHTRKRFVSSRRYGEAAYLCMRSIRTPLPLARYTRQIDRLQILKNDRPIVVKVGVHRTQITMMHRSHLNYRRLCTLPQKER